MDERRRRCWSAILFALPWSLPVYAFVASALIVVNEKVLGMHVFDASSLASAAALSSVLGAAAWSEWHDRHPAVGEQLRPLGEHVRAGST